MNWAIYLCAAAVVQADTGGLSVQLELGSSRVHLGDPLFARVTLTNNSGETVNLPNDLFRTTGYSVHPARSNYSYRFRSDHVTGEPLSVPVSPGEKCTIDYEILEFPPIREWTRDFWQTSLGRRAELIPHVWTRSEEVSRMLPRMDTSCVLRIEDRPAQEIEFVAELLGKAGRRDQLGISLPEEAGLAPAPGDFGLRSLKPYPDLIDSLITYEERLSPGSLKDIVHLVRLLRTIYQSPDASEQTRYAEELVRWLDTLPEIERRCLAMRMISAVGYSGADEPPIHMLIYETVQRLPEKLYEFPDYRAYRLREFANSRPGFEEYLKQQN